MAPEVRSDGANWELGTVREEGGMGISTEWMLLIQSRDKCDVIWSKKLEH